MDPTIMNTIIRFGLPREVARLLLLLSYLAVPGGRVAGAPALPSEGSAPEAILSEARLSLAEGRKDTLRSEGCCWLVSSSGRHSLAGRDRIIWQPGALRSPDL